MAMGSFFKFETVLFKIHELSYMDYESSTFSRAKILTNKDDLTIFRQPF